MRFEAPSPTARDLRERSHTNACTTVRGTGRTQADWSASEPFVHRQTSWIEKDFSSSQDLGQTRQDLTIRRSNLNPNSGRDAERAGHLGLDPFRSVDKLLDHHFETVHTTGIQQLRNLFAAATSRNCSTPCSSTSASRESTRPNSSRTGCKASYTLASCCLGHGCWFKRAIRTSRISSRHCRPNSPEGKPADSRKPAFAWRSGSNSAHWEDQTVVEDLRRTAAIADQLPDPIGESQWPLRENLVDFLSRARHTEAKWPGFGSAIPSCIQRARLPSAIFWSTKDVRLCMRMARKQPVSGRILVRRLRWATIS